MSTIAASVGSFGRNGKASCSNEIPRGREQPPASLEKERRQQALKPPIPEKKAVRANSEPHTKERKRASPFRIKAGYLVALRHRDGGNNVTAVSPSGITKDLSNLRSPDHFFDVWTDPVPGRDEGLALIGKRVRCIFPLFVTADDQSQRAQTRLLEGEIVAIVDYESNWPIQQRRRSNRDANPFAVELLVDKSALVTLPFLERVDENVDYANLRPVQKKRQRFEDIIRGENKIVVRVLLEDNSGSITSKGDSSNLVAKWAMRKRVPLQMSGPARYEQLFGEETSLAGMETMSNENFALKSSKTGHTATAFQQGTGEPLFEKAPHESTSENDGIDAVQRAASNLEPRKKRMKTTTKKYSNDLTKTRYVGDGNDAVPQQERNWRWWAGRSHDMELFAGRGKRLGWSEQISYGFVGEVLTVLPESSQSSTLATVTLRRMILPAHTVGGRLLDNGIFELYDDKDSFVETKADGKMVCNNFVTYRVPVEELVIVCRGIARSSQAPSASAQIPLHPTVSLSYSLQNNIFTPISDTCKPNETLPIGNADTASNVCHWCRTALPTIQMMSCNEICTSLPTSSSEEAKPAKWWCDRCLRNLQRADGDQVFPCCSLTCICRDCRSLAGTRLQFRLREDVIGALSKCSENEKCPNSQFVMAHRSIAGIKSADFYLPADFLERVSLCSSSGKPITRIPKPRMQKIDKKSPDMKVSLCKTTESKNRLKLNGKRKIERKIDERTIPTPQSNEEQSCSRALPYDPKSKLINVANFSGAEEGEDFSVGGLPIFHEMPRNLRQLQQLLSAKPEKEDKTNSSRAARASQRRIMKDVAALGATSLGLDALAGREQKLRFDRSGIHAWGVFADEAIAVGDMIVEYRGELIGNAMAEKREKEYEKAKIGSDYMFRVDAQVVCDATKQGNVARFINASCDPNCYTKTITVDATKRIVIYAKRDIRAGEELCYDYKFPLEYDESKRIPCFCGARECRGFMNWNKRYVALPIPNLAVGNDGMLRRGSLKHTEG